MCRIVSFISASGGLGQTSIIYELSNFLSKKKFNVCVIDGHFNINTLSLKYGETGADLMDYLLGKANIFDVLFEAKKNLKVIKTNYANFDYTKFSEEIKDLIFEISENFDYILIDVNSFDKKELEFGLECSNEVLMIISDDENNLRNSAKLLQKVYLKQNIMCVNIVMNKARIISQINGKSLSDDDVFDIFKIHPLFVFPKFYKYNIFSENNLSKNQDMILKKFCFSFITNERKFIDLKKMYKGCFGLIRRKVYEKYE